MATPPLRSALCTERSLTSPELVAWADRIRPAWDLSGSGVPVYVHRKLWEWLYIIEALAERDLLRAGRSGLGLGVGQDPLAALFASLGCTVVATDVGCDQAAQDGWVASNQHASDLSQLNSCGICDPDRFSERVRFREVDMRSIPEDLRGFDFTWSACAFEHLGSLAAGQEFVLRQMDCLRPGGIAVHTTEFNVGSNWSTVGTGQTVLYRRRDIGRLVRQLRRLGHQVDVDFAAGTGPADVHVDDEPWTDTHLKVRFHGFVTTSLALIMEKGPSGSSRPWRPDRRWRVHRAAERVRFGGARRLHRLVDRSIHPGTPPAG
ncbi:MAG: class I SAM-dependent methyltransferase [Acidimicrobiales bacterium]